MRLSKLIVLLVLTLTGLSACGTTSSSFTGPSGERISTVRCTTDPTKCYQKASASCGGGSYSVVNSYRNAGGIFADLVPGPVTWYTMSLVCGRSDGVVPTFPLRGQEPAMPKIEVPPTIVQPAPAPSMQQSTTTECRSVGTTIRCTTR